ncbi:uncharacterized protein GGS22DRAFT_162295 [Annulohypoxylon maeteangense]|uniref:uncharacterized protein n=1 Tax=Annulohypoxylon maeteangense TaxID=1927788 RepID=UPI002008CD8E|nr:uncharacterized protein GGS22DRAFT_162295 [Annulohypoxylon maeteangense]KAI0885919.1 hypothetical protein GGS22DRAFT_162295 [Annulohypoxylon maeteangense]
MDLPPAPNGLYNRWNLALHWGNCSGPNCHVRNNLLKCGACRAVYYCGGAHQRAHRPQHKSSCNLIKNARAQLAQEEAALRARPGDMFLEANPFETARGSFWRFTPTRPYMQARFDLISTLLNIKTGAAVEEALEHSLDMLQLNPGDNQGIRSHVPALYLRLGRDQEAYDFIKWYGTIGAQSGYEWGNPESPFLNLHDEDVFEPLGGIAKALFDLSIIVSLVNVKVRLLLDIRGLEKEFNKPAKRNTSYEKKMEWVRENATCDVLYKRRDIVERTEWTDLVAALESQAKEVFDRVEGRNKHYWPALRSPELHAAAIPTAYSPGSPEEVKLVFRNTWYSWAECPPAHELVKSWHAA